MMHSQNAHTMSSVLNTEKTRDEVLASVGRGFGLPRLGFHFNMRSPRTRMGGPYACLYFLRAVMYRPAYGPPIRGFIFGSPIYVFF